MHHLSNFLFFGIPLLYYYINLNSSMICCLSCGDICLSFDISLLASLKFNSLEFNSLEFNSLKFNSLDFVDTLVILSTILLPIKSPVASVVF